MKFCLSGIAVTVLLLCFTGSVSAELLDSSSLDEIKEVEVEAGEVVTGWTIQFENSVKVKNKTRMRLSLKMLRHAMRNRAVAGDLFMTVEEGGEINREHLKGCRSISSLLSGSIVNFTAGHFKMVKTTLVTVEVEVGRLPAPINLTLVRQQFIKLTKNIITFSQLNIETKESWILRLEGKKGSIGRGSTKGSIGKGSTKGSKGKGSKGKGSKGKGSKGKGSTKGSKGSTTISCVDNPTGCAALLRIDTSVTGWELIDWSIIDLTIIDLTVIDITTISWESRISVKGIINWKGLECTGDPGVQCYTCQNGRMVYSDGSTCDDRNSCTKNDVCFSGVCAGQSELSPVTPCN